ncbi:MAG TPA: hypothetical protein VMV45_02915 [Casimicrobiaceae bacterium]|nr:hypothetical protein [Casimicrobiaceae bacterium]
MNDEHAERIVRLLEEIRDGQRLQLERQAQALARQEEVFAQQRERIAGALRRAGEADELLANSKQVVGGARVLVLIAVPFAVLALGFVAWILFARAVS